jgi:capsular exopolysaccharide synthesis family protein
MTIQDPATESGRPQPDNGPRPRAPGSPSTVAARGGDAAVRAATPQTPGERSAAAAGGRSIRYTRTASFTPSPKVQQAQRLVTALDDSAAIAGYKLLRTQVLQRMKAKGWRALAVTSPGPGEGKTLTAVNLALSLAQDVNQTVLLVDLDLRHPGVHRAFGYEPAAGIGDHLFDGVPLPDILFTPGVERLVILPGRESVASSSEVLASPLVVNLVEELKNRYPDRLVVFDLPPVLSADDALAFSPYVDAVLMVVEEGRTTRDGFERALRYLGQTPVLGTVLNRTAEKLHSYD